LGLSFVETLGRLKWLAFRFQWFAWGLFEAKNMSITINTWRRPETNTINAMLTTA
jgi:hypothetical protein